MKSNGFLLVTIFGVSVGLVSYATAGPAVSSGPAQPESGIISSGSQLPSGVSPGLNASNSVAGQSGGPSQTGSAATTANSGASATGPGTSQSGYNPGLSNGTSTNGPTAVDLKKERVAEVSDKDLAAERVKNQSKSEVTKKFESSLLNADVASIDQIKSANEANSSEASADKRRGAPAPQASVAVATPQN